MRRAVSSRMGMALGFLIVALAAVALLGACTPNASVTILSPNMSDQLALEEAGVQVTAATPTPVPQLVNLTPEQIYAGLPEDLAQAVATANLENGSTLYTSKACIGCHALDPAMTMTGPTWHNIGDTAIGRMPGVSPAEYLHQSIINPGAYIVPNYQNVMPANYSDLLTTQELADLLAFLLAQNGQP